MSRWDAGSRTGVAESTRSREVAGAPGGARSENLADSLLADGLNIRAPDEGDWATLHSAANQVFRPFGGDLFAESPLLFAPSNRENLRVAVVDGQIVGHAGVLLNNASVFGRTVPVAAIGAVFTLPAHRGQGIARRLISDLLATSAAHAEVVLVSGDGPLYRGIGFAPIPPLTRYPLAGGRQPLPDGLTLSRSTAGDIGTLAALHAKEPVRFERTELEWLRIYSAARLMDRAASIWIVSQSGASQGAAAAVAYLAVQDEITTADGTARSARVLELAGDREALVAAAPLVADEMLVPAYDDAIRIAADRIGWIGHKHPLPITWKRLRPCRPEEEAEEQEDERVAPVVPWYGLNYL